MALNFTAVFCWVKPCGCRLSDFLVDCAERIIVMKIVYRRLMNRWTGDAVVLSDGHKQNLCAYAILALQQYSYCQWWAPRGLRRIIRPWSEFWFQRYIYWLGETFQKQPVLCWVCLVKPQLSQSVSCQWWLVDVFMSDFTSSHFTLATAPQAWVCVKWRRSVAAAFRSSRAFFVHEHVCMRRTLLNLRQADSLAFSVCGDTLGIIFCDAMVVFFDILVWFPCWLVQQ